MCYLSRQLRHKSRWRTDWFGATVSKYLLNRRIDQHIVLTVLIVFCIYLANWCETGTLAVNTTWTSGTAPLPCVRRLVVKMVILMLNVVGMLVVLKRLSLVISFCYRLFLRHFFLTSMSVRCLVLHIITCSILCQKILIDIRARNILSFNEFRLLLLPVNGIISRLGLIYDQLLTISDIASRGWIAQHLLATRVHATLHLILIRLQLNSAILRNENLTASLVVHLLFR